MEQYRTVLPFLKKSKWKYAAGILLLMLVDSANLYIPQVIRQFTDMVQFNRLTPEGIWKSFLMIALLGIGIAVGRFGWRMLIYGTSRGLEYDLRDRLFSHFLKMDADFYNHRKVGELMAHATNDVRVIRMAFGPGVMMIVDSLFMATLTIVSMFLTVGFKTALVALASLPFISIAVSYFGKHVHTRSLAVQNTFSQMTGVVQENFSGVRVIKAFAIEKERESQFDEVNRLYRQKNLYQVRLSGMFRPMITAISGLSFVLFMLFGTYQVFVGEITLGDFIAVTNYLNMIVWPMVAFGEVFNTFQKGLAAMERVNHLLEENSEIGQSTNPVALPAPVGNLKFENVSFRYGPQTPEVLKNISFELKLGETLAIIGRTGSGKSTIADLILRIYDVDSGRITLDGVDIRDLSLKDLRAAIAYAPQNNFLFSKSIKDNIAFGSDEPITEEDAIEAATFADLHENVMGFPEGYDTMVGERGVTLSGGQKQRLTIAMAYIKKAPLLIFDDTLSAVDTKTEDAILDNIRGIGDKGLLVISQRISTIKHADHILVLDEGQIVQRGDHDTLITQEGLYRKIYERQLLEAQTLEASDADK